jgi:methyl-accepting chemotaxis protein
VVPTADNKPSSGRFIAARYLSGSELESLRAQVGIDFRLEYLAGQTALTPGISELRGKDQLQVVKPLTSLDPSGSLAVVATLPRPVMTEGRATVARSAFVMLASAAVITLCLVVALQLREVNRIGRLQRHATELSRTGDLTSRVCVEGSDEIASLADEFNQMLARLDESQRSPTDLSRRAGMAEVASGVLHNVGNP